MNLASLQKDLLDVFFNTDNKSATQVANRYLKPHAKLSKEQCLTIYRNSVHGVLKQHLCSVYPVSQQLIGKQRFRVLCDQFIDQYPPGTPYLSEYGEQLPTFFMSLSAFTKLKWVVDMVTLEWARHCAWHAANQEASDFTALSTVTQDEQALLVFYLPKSAHLLRFSSAIDDIWRIHQLDDVEDISKKLEAVDMNDERFIIVYRQGKKLYQTSLDKQVWLFLSRCREGASLATLSEEFGEALATCLSTTVKRGWISSFE